MTIPDGTLAGRQVIILEPFKPFRFMDLPPEIRTMVYRCHFDETITAALAKNKKRVRRGEYGVHSIVDNQSDKGRTLNISMHRVSDIELLRVSKDILEEAAPIVYEKHTFECREDHSIKACLQLLGSMAKFVQHVSLRCCTGVENENLEELAKATHLRTVSIDLCIFHRDEFEGVRHFVSKLLDSFLRQLHDSLRPDSKLKVLDVVKVGQNICPLVLKDQHDDEKCRKSHFHRNNLPAHIEDLNPRLRAEIADQLGIKISWASRTTGSGV